MLYVEASASASKRQPPANAGAALHGTSYEAGERLRWHNRGGSLARREASYMPWQKPCHLTASSCSCQSLLLRVRLASGIMRHRRRASTIIDGASACENSRAWQRRLAGMRRNRPRCARERRHSALWRLRKCAPGFVRISSAMLKSACRITHAPASYQQRHRGRGRRNRAAPAEAGHGAGISRGNGEYIGKYDAPIVPIGGARRRGRSRARR